MKNVIKVVSFILIIITLLTITSVCACYRYNNGECRFCENGNLVFINATSGGQNKTTDYLFNCDNCGKVFTFAINPTLFN